MIASTTKPTTATTTTAKTGTTSTSTSTSTWKLQDAIHTSNALDEKSIIAGPSSHLFGPAMRECNKEEPCFTPSKVRVSDNRPGFPSFWNYAHTGPISVEYDNRSILINGDRVFFLGGSMHPSRATRGTWNHALEEAVQNGLNMITIYVMWAAHQPVPSKDIDWNFPQGINGGGGDDDCDDETGFQKSSSSLCKEWSLASAIRAAADRGLFVHLRIGPYDCAEYSYGGIPEWLALHKPKLAMRRPNKQWLELMEGFVTKMVAYISEHQLWAHQGGNIIMGQIENELGGNMDPSKEHLLLVDENGNFVDPDDDDVDPSSHRHLRNATLQDYADWCGTLVDRLAKNVTWTMCNGLSAQNTINTCNDVGGGVNFLENHGGSGRIQIDQPPIFTEFEGGFQTWGETAENPSDYFWGRTARSMARDALKWFARGGTHLNYYMWWGGYNRGRSAAAGITNMYASDVPLCPSGQRRQPKFGHFEKLHHVMADIASTLLVSDTALGKAKSIPFQQKDNDWSIGEDQRIFEYRASYIGLKDVLFIENDAEESVQVKVEVRPNDTRIYEMAGKSGIILLDGFVEFDSASIEPRKMAFERKFADDESLPMLLDWSSWDEPMGPDVSNPLTWTKNFPVEQTELNVASRVYSDYGWYETSFNLDQSLADSQLFIETQYANAFVAYLDSKFVGAADTHLHKEGPTTLSIKLGHIEQGKHVLTLLSESLGYNNLIGRWGGSTDAKPKGITGDVLLGSTDGLTNTSLVDGREWRSFPGLRGEMVSGNEIRREKLEHRLDGVRGNLHNPTWSSVLFDTPRYDPTVQALFINIRSGRGHLWLNGQDLGRYWNITKGDSEEYTQEYYFLPADYLYTDGRLNEIVFFDAFGSLHQEISSLPKLAISWLSPTNDPNFLDKVDFPNACI